VRLQILQQSGPAGVALTVLENVVESVAGGPNKLQDKRVSATVDVREKNQICREGPSRWVSGFRENEEAGEMDVGKLAEWDRSIVGRVLPERF
jgi:hypothetical protein